MYQYGPKSSTEYFGTALSLAAVENWYYSVNYDLKCRYVLC